MYIMSFILVSGKPSSHFNDTTKPPGNSYDDKKDCSDSEECCKTLFEDRLSTDHGAAPKTRSTLLHKIKDVDSLAATVDDIKRQLSGMTQSYTVILYYMHVYIVAYYFLMAIFLGS